MKLTWDIMRCLTLVQQNGAKLQKLLSKQTISIRSNIKKNLSNFNIKHSMICSPMLFINFLVPATKETIWAKPRDRSRNIWKQIKALHS